VTPSAAFDVVVVGGGLGGLSTALRLAETGLSVAVLRKKPSMESSSAWAQGGIAAAMDTGDTPAQHAADTLVAGGGLCKPATVDFVVGQAPDAIRWLEAQGVAFTPAGPNQRGSLHLTREGGHGRRRVVHAADATGHAVITGLTDRVAEHPTIQLLDDRIGIDLITSAKQGLPGPNRCVGIHALNRVTGRVETIAARAVVLATGGASKIYLYTTNPDTSTGDGIAMAWRAGCRVANLEFMQFHPTCLYHPQAKNFLISEAMRGEGGILLLPDGTRFMRHFDVRMELAPRDIVARAIDRELKRTGDACAYLDMTHLSRAEIEHKFPSIDARCRELGIDMAVSPIPVVPAAHYLCGGAMTDLHGETNVENLFVAGEAACTGLHGANRLASNSLLEAAHFGRQAALEIVRRLPSLPPPPVLPEWDPGSAAEPDEQVVISQLWDEIRRFMWNYVGIVRTTRRLERARKRIELVQEEIRTYYWDFKLTGDLVELRNLAQVAQLVIECALRRLESRGLHYTLDHPETDDRFLHDTVLKKRY